MSQLTQDGRAADGPLDPAEIAPPESAPAAPQDRSSGHPSMLRMLLRDKFACTGAVILVLVFLTAIFGPNFTVQARTSFTPAVK